MLIRSQNKQVIINMDCVDSIMIDMSDKAYRINSFNGIGASKALIGDYSSEEKAIKVLDIICARYLNTKKCISQDEEIYLFQAPKDEDVNEYLA